MIISENIKSFRLKKNYTQQELASLMNISRQSISKWETGKSLPTIDNLLKLSVLLEMPLEKMITQSTLPPLPVVFDKPRNRIPLYLKSLPFLFFAIIGLLTLDKFYLLLAAFSLFILLFCFQMDYYNFKRYYNYFIVNPECITVFDGKIKLEFLTIVKSAFGFRKEISIPYEKIISATILFDTIGNPGWGTVIAYRPRQLAMNRETFNLEIKTSDQIYTLSLDSVFYSHSNERKILPSLIRFFKEKGIEIIDEKNIIYSIQEELDFISEAYSVQKAMDSIG